MNEKVSAPCATPRCKESVAKSGGRYHRVFSSEPPSFMPDAKALCNSCGGYTNGVDWLHVCRECGKLVAPGELKGLFVPHNCPECDARIVTEERAAGKVCRLCHSVYSYCCC